MRPIPELFGACVGGSSHPEYAVWIAQNGFSVVKDGKEESPYFLIWKPREQIWTCTCPSYTFRGWCKHPEVVKDILTDAVLGGRLR